VKRILPLFLAAFLLLPAQAQATGTHSPTKPLDCPCCVDLDTRIDQLELVWNQRISTLEQRITVLEQRLEQQNNWINEINNRVSITINRIDALSCRSSRVYTFRLRTSVDGSRINGVSRVLVAGVEERGAFTLDDDSRWVITADYRGLEVPRGQLRTVTVHVTTEDGRSWRLVQMVRLCLENDGNPNDTPAQDRAND
jgi:hypothetical protein